MSADINPPYRPTKRINRMMVFSVSLVVLLLTVFLSNKTFFRRNPKVEEETALAATTTKPVLDLPLSYADLKEPEPPKKMPDIPKELKLEKVAPMPTMAPIKDDAAIKALSSSILFKKTADLSQEIKTSDRSMGEGGFSNMREDEESGFIVEAKSTDGAETRINQANKKAFVKTAEGFDQQVILKYGLQTPISAYQVMAGSIIPAALITGINSDLPGQIIAQVRENIYDTVTGRYLLIPQGTKILGRYDNMVAWGQERNLMIWSRLMFPNGQSILLDNMAGHDNAGYAGLKDGVNNHYMKIAGAVLVSAFLSVGAREAGGDIDGFHPTTGQMLAEEVASDVNRSGQKIVNRMLNIPPTLTARPGFPCTVMVNKDMVLSPYEEG